MKTKITEFYLDKAKYKAVDENGNQISVEINYWDNKFALSCKNESLEKFARKLLNKKHKVNFVDKMLE